jgi:hypothetical protein
VCVIALKCMTAATGPLLHSSAAYEGEEKARVPHFRTEGFVKLCGRFVT